MQMEMSLSKAPSTCTACFYKTTKQYSFNSFPKGGTSQRPLVYLLDLCWVALTVHGAAQLRLVLCITAASESCRRDRLVSAEAV